MNYIKASKGRESMIYFDYAATTPVDSEVFKTYQKITKEYWGNSSSLHRFGLQSNELLNHSYKEFQAALGLTDKRIIYTSGSTEANNLGIYGIINQYHGKKRHIITTQVEHPAIFEVFKSMEQRGISVTYLSVDAEGIINLEELKQAMTKDTILVSVMWVNNVIGTIEPIKEVIEIVKQYPKCTLLVDAVQGITKIKPDFNLNDVDMFTLSTHKIYGNKGAGALVYKSNIELDQHLYGSKQQFGIKPGTVDLANAVATTKAVKKYQALLEEHYQDVSIKYHKLRSTLEKNPNILINSPKQNYTPYILNISIPSINGEVLVRHLEEKDIMVSTGAACSSKERRLEKTVYATTYDEQRAMSSIRISLSHLNTIEEIDTLIEALTELTGE
jgi:cysteine desulfurase